MISFLSPWILVAAAVTGAAITVLHFLSVRRPPVYMLPTARFIVARDARAVSRSTRPSDVLLLLLRVLAVLAAGAALAGPRWTAARQSIAHLIVADAGWRADSSRLAAIATDAGATSGERVVAARSDAVTRIVFTDTVGAMRGELGAAWPTAWRAAASLLHDEPSVDSIALHVFVPAGSASFDGWYPWRRAWPGTVEVHAVPVAARNSAPQRTVGVTLVREARSDDVVRAGLVLHAIAVAETAVDTVRGVTLQWPANGIPDGWASAVDTVGALVSGGTAVVAPWTRRARPPSATAPGTRVIARWSDGVPAALETVSGSSCRRTVGVFVPNGSDVLNTRAARGLFRALAAPCGTVVLPVPAGILADSGGRQAMASAATLRRLLPRSSAVVPRWLPALLLGAAIALLMLETILRRSRDDEKNSRDGDQHARARDDGVRSVA